MDSRINKILEAVTESQNLLDEVLTGDILKKMTPEQLSKIDEVKKMTSSELLKTSEQLQEINNKYR